MEITKERVVSITYELRQDTEKGQVVEQVTAEQPLTFMFGIGGMLPKFEENLAGLKIGDNFKFGLTSEDAYGPVVENAIVDVPIDVFKVDGKVDENVLKVGNSIPMMDNNGNRLQGTVTVIQETAVKMDFNHPMAGKDLFFSGEVTEVREATEQELNHGHVHQEGGCGSEGCCGGDAEHKGNCDDPGSGGCCGGH